MYINLYSILHASLDVQQRHPRYLRVVTIKTNKGHFFLKFFEFIEEMEWAIETAVTTGLPVVATMCIRREGDHNRISCTECAVRMAKAGAHVGKLLSDNLTHSTLFLCLI